MALVIAVIVCISTICYGANLSSSVDWAKVTQKDLDFSYQSIQRIVPYTFFQSEPQLEDWLKKGMRTLLNKPKLHPLIKPINQSWITILMDLKLSTWRFLSIQITWGVIQREERRVKWTIMDF